MFFHFISKTDNNNEKRMITLQQISKLLKTNLYENYL